MTEYTPQEIATQAEVLLASRPDVPTGVPITLMGDQCFHLSGEWFVATHFQRIGDDVGAMVWARSKGGISHLFSLEVLRGDKGQPS